MTDGDEYLQEGFDPRSVTMPRLRSILVTHNVDYPSTAKKPQLVQLVHDHVLSQAPRLRAERARAKRSSYGIVNAGSADDINTWADHDLPPPRSVTRRSGSPRKSSARRPADEDRAEPAQMSPRKRSSRSASRQLLRADEDETPPADVARSARRTRRTVTPQIKVESEDDAEEDELHLPQQELSVFTDDNPFQSGSSPPAAKSPLYRRRTAGDDVFRSVKTPTRTERSADHQARARKLFDVATPRLRSETPEELLEPGEEFTPDEQLELERAAREGEMAIHERKPALDVARRTSLKTPLVVLFLALLSAYGAWYRQEKVAVGYCGLGRPAKSILPPSFPVPDALVPLIEPQCEQCPPHAYCYQDFSMRCEPDFILKPHPLSLGGMVPLPPSCEPDGEKARRVQAVADKAVEELRERRARFECGKLADETGQPLDSPAIAEDELKESVGKRRNKRLSRHEFDELWAAAVGEVAARDEVESSEGDEAEPADSVVPARRFSSTSLARLPLACAVKRSVRLGLARYRVPIGLLILVTLAVLYLRAQYRRHLATAARVPALVDAVLGRLAHQKELGEEDLDDAWLFLPNLRDDVLRSVHSLSERERIWQRVRAVVEQNSNVRTGQREGRSGEVGRAWEWIGPGRGDAARRRRSGRVSWGPEPRSESPGGGLDVPETRKWEDPRPIY